MFKVFSISKKDISNLCFNIYQYLLFKIIDLISLQISKTGLSELTSCKIPLLIKKIIDLFTIYSIQ